jgi:hypothetical protein
VKYAAGKLISKRIARALKKGTSPSAVAAAERRRKFAKAMWYASRIPPGVTADEYLVAVVDHGLDKLRRRKKKQQR